MATTTEKATATEWLALNWPSFIAMAAIVILVTGLYVEGGHVGSVSLINLLSLAFPFSVIASSSFICWVHVLRIGRKDPGWFGSIVFFLAFAICLVVGLALGEASDAYNFLSRIWVATPWFSTMSACGFAVILLFARSLRPKNPPFIFMLVLTFLFLMALTPLGENVFPLSGDIGAWIQTNISQTGNDIIWMLIYLADVGMVIRIFTLREKLRVG